MKAIIMAGGFGTRLRPLTVNIPKPMVPMVNKPMMEHIVTLLKENGFDDLLVMLYFQPEVIIRHFGDGAAFGVAWWEPVGGGVPRSFFALLDRGGRRVRRRRSRRRASCSSPFARSSPNRQR